MSEELAPTTLDARTPLEIESPTPSTANNVGRQWYYPAALSALLAATALLYLWRLTSGGWASSFYSAVAWAGSEDWKAWLFGSVDPANSITMDKPPAATWVTALSIRIFGLSPASILVPEAVMGVATVGVVCAAVRRASNSAAGLLAGGVVACMPATATIFRFNFPDALLVLTISVAAYCLIRGIQSERDRNAALWLIATGVVVGLAFLTKMVSGLLVVPGFAVAYLVAGRTNLAHRILHLLGAGMSVFLAAGWWVLLTSLWPADSRPVIGGSSKNSTWDLVIDGNGLSRIDRASSNGLPGNLLDGGHTGFERLLSNEMGNEIGWLIPCALIALVCGVASRHGAPRTDLARAGLIAWGGWLIVTATSFSFASWIHPYYSAALAPAVGAVIAIGAYSLWLSRHRLAARAALAAMSASAGAMSWVLLSRYESWLPGLDWAIAVGAAASAGLLIYALKRDERRATFAAVSLAATVSLAGPASYAIATAGYVQPQLIPFAGPQNALPRPPQTPMDRIAWGKIPTDPKLVALLRSAGSSYRWAAATSWSSAAGRTELDGQVPVLPIGGYFGYEGPSLKQFQALVGQHDVHYYVLLYDGPLPPHPYTPHTPVRAIEEWVTAHYQPITVGTATVYDMTSHDEPAAH